MGFLSAYLGSGEGEESPPARREPSDLEVAALLATIRRYENFAGEWDNDAAYRRIVGSGGVIEDFSDHPQVAGMTWTDKSGRKQMSTAAGAYQIVGSTYKGLKRFPEFADADFSPEWQDRMALRLIKDDKGRPLDHLARGDYRRAIAEAGRNLWEGVGGLLHEKRYGKEASEKRLAEAEEFFKNILAGEQSLPKFYGIEGMPEGYQGPPTLQDYNRQPNRQAALLRMVGSGARTNRVQAAIDRYFASKVYSAFPSASGEQLNEIMQRIQPMRAH